MAHKPTHRDTLISTVQAGRYLNRQPRTVRAYVDRGILPRRFIGKILVHSIADLDRLKRSLPLPEGSTGRK